MIVLIISAIFSVVGILFTVGTLVIKIIYSISRSIYGMSVTKGVEFQDNSKHSRRAREARKIDAEVHALAELALTRASWSDEFIREHGVKQRKKDEKFLRRTYRAVKWKTTGLLMPQGLTQVFATRFFTITDNEKEVTDSEGNTDTQVIDPNWKNGFDEAEGNGNITHPYRSSVKIAIIAVIALRTIEPDIGLVESIVSGISLGLTIPFVLRCFEIMETIRLRFLAEKTHRAVVISQYPCVEGRNISEKEKEFIAYVCEMYRKYEGESAWKPIDDYGLLMPYEFCAYLGNKGAIGKTDNWIDRKLSEIEKAGDYPALLFREVGKQTASEDEAYGKDNSNTSYVRKAKTEKESVDIAKASELVRKECELLADCLSDVEMMNERYDKLKDMHYFKQLSDEDWVSVEKWYSYIIPIMNQCKVSLSRTSLPNHERDTSVSTDESIFGHRYRG